MNKTINQKTCPFSQSACSSSCQLYCSSSNSSAPDQCALSVLALASETLLPLNRHLQSVVYLMDKRK